MCWFLVDPETGQHVRRVSKPVKSGGERVYVNDLVSDALHHTAWHFHEFLARYPTRPPLEDLATFVVEGSIPTSFRGFNRQKLKAHQAAFT